MPSLPTSLILVGLVVAWLVVLVPMVSKRREEVPENDESGAGFRVLERESMARRAPRPVLSRTAYGIDADGAADDRGDGAAGADVLIAPARGDGSDAYDDGPGDAGSDSDPRTAADTEIASAGTDVEFDAEADTVHGPGYDPMDEDSDGAVSGDAAGDDPERYRPVPMRPGRGGFDPLVAAETRQYRFQQRRRVALALLLMALLGLVSGLAGWGTGWVVAVGGGVLLVLYLAYLRRQVRIEEEIRQRRAARQRRARQSRPQHRGTVADQVKAHRLGVAPQAGLSADDDGQYRAMPHSRGTLPPAYRGSGIPVDLDDDDPAFDTLEYYRPAGYRRVAS